VRKTQIIITLAVLFLLVIGGKILIDIYGNPFKVVELESKVKKYLMNNKGYKPEEISTIKGYYSWKDGKYYARVIFSDEVQTEYTYYLNNKGIIKQGGYSYPNNNVSFKHNE
jgi:hypothetical protein